ncbi:MAG: hypothetical protein JSS75_04280 [Bacteroidetes bacterium]|nr:hypothetical protein [Bacteroidota bacterium]
MNVLENLFDFHQLSVKDLLDARDHFHVHLMNKKNVVATAIGRYLIRRSDPRPGTAASKRKPRGPKPARTLENSEVRDYSWPCVLVFVSQWEQETSLMNNASDILPTNIYLPDGRVAPICVVEAPKSAFSQTVVDPAALNFPKNMISGGFPILLTVQGQQRIASVGCLVSDGNKTYALTNRHVTGDQGTVIYSKLGSTLSPIGTSSSLQLGKVGFGEAYPEWPVDNVVINTDVGLIEVDDAKIWKTEVFGIGAFDELADLNTANLSLRLIGAPVCGYGAVSGKLEGAIAALFYRYKSIGGTEYLSEFLIGARRGTSLGVHHGDSGTLWLLEQDGKRHPIALQWGQHEFLSGDGISTNGYALASSLSTICRLLDVDLVRGWNLDQDYSWGKTGHFKIAASACDVVSGTKIAKLLKANKFLIGYSDADLESGDSIAKAKSKDFIPLADVPDLCWRYIRFKTEGPNHFADMDESNPKVAKGKSLLELCKQDSYIDVDKWIQFYKDFDAVDPKTSIDRITKKEVPAPRQGAVPFRVWQMYEQMVKSLKAGNLDEFICAGGAMSHYVGDACQPLHVSYLHAGIPGHETNVHGEYEDKMVDANAEALFAGVNKINSKRKVKKTDLITGGKAAARLTIELMRSTFKTLPPKKILDVFGRVSGRGKYTEAWKTLGTPTINVVANGCYAMAVLWQSAWVEGNGDVIAATKLTERNTNALIQLYTDFHFVQSYALTDERFKQVLT